MTEKLKPCPFCGAINPTYVNDPTYINGKFEGHVWCGSCLATMPQHDPDVPDAVERWNTRLPPCGNYAEFEDETISKFINSPLPKNADPEDFWALVGKILSAAIVLAVCVFSLELITFSPAFKKGYNAGYKQAVIDCVIKDGSIPLQCDPPN